MYTKTEIWISENVIKDTYFFLPHNIEAQIHPNLCTFYRMGWPMVAITIQTACFLGGKKTKNKTRNKENK